MRAAAAVAVLLAGCTQQTGLLLEVHGPDGIPSTTAGVSALEYVVAHPSWCERWVQDLSASRTAVDVRGRDLGKRPYALLLHPVHLTDIDEKVFAIALARNGAGRVIGEAVFDAMRFEAGTVALHRQRVSLLGRRDEADGPMYATDDGCVCLPGQPWLATGTGTGCDLRVPSSFDRVVDTAGCELPPNATRLPVPVCDGQIYPGEEMDRMLPCFATRTLDGQTSCAVGVRGCHDTKGYAYDRECQPDSYSPALPSSTLCDAYRVCERNACADPVDCLRRALTPVARSCTLRIDPSAPAGTIRPCADGKWRAPLDGTASGASCVATAIDGLNQPPLTVGPFDITTGAVQPVASSCPPVLGVDSIDVDSFDRVPDTMTVDLTVGDHLVRATLHVVFGCAANVPSLVCQ
jgi:hypothetical protein